VAALRDMDGVKLVRTAGSVFQMVVLNGCLLFPFRYAHDARIPIGEARITDRYVSGRVRALFARFGPCPAYDQGLLFPDDSEQESEMADLGPALDELPADTRLVLIAFACNDQAGLINAWWGEAELVDDYGRLRWTSRPEQLRLPVGHHHAGKQSRPATEEAADAQLTTRFDSGDMPQLATGIRPRVSQDADGAAAMDNEGSPRASETVADERR
jgi:hypothetical protein